MDLKVQDAKTKRFRTFRPTFEVADLRIEEMVILGYDWFSETRERIGVGPPGGLGFKVLSRKLLVKLETLRMLLQKLLVLGYIKFNRSQ